MNWLDIVILAIIALSVASGFSQGFVKIGIGFASLVLAFLLAAWGYGLAGDWLVGFVSSRAIANMLGFGVVFVGVMLAGSLLAALLSRILRVVGLSWADRLLGGGFGLVRGLTVVVTGLLILTAFTRSPPAVVVQSQVAPYALKAAHVLSAVTPYEIRNGFRRSYDQIDHLWKEALGRRAPRSRTEE